MINIQRTTAVIEEKYDAETTKELLKNDFFKMCYLCEEVTRHYEIDHFYPQKYFPHLVNDWENLFYICEKCNKIRPKDINTQDKNEVLNNTKDDVEDWITLCINDKTGNIDIKGNTQNKDKHTKTKINNSVLLLQKVYQGIDTKSKSYLDLRKEIKNKVETFIQILETYQKASTTFKPWYKKQIIKHLSKKSGKAEESSFVSFKRKIIRDNPDLIEIFYPYFD